MTVQVYSEYRPCFPVYVGLCGFGADGICVRVNICEPDRVICTSNRFGTGNKRITGDDNFTMWRQIGGLQRYFNGICAIANPDTVVTVTIVSKCSFKLCQFLTTDKFCFFNDLEYCCVYCCFNTVVLSGQIQEFNHPISVSKLPSCRYGPSGISNHIVRYVRHVQSFT